MVELNEVKRGYEIAHKSLSINFIWAACEDCGKERWVALVRNKPRSSLCRSCSLKLRHKRMPNLIRGVNNPHWKGGRTKSYGYILIKLQPDDFFYRMASKYGRVLEHRLVMAKHLNRCLLPWEVVHHKNGIRDDNRLDNLQLLPTGKYHIIDPLTKNLIKKLVKRIISLETENIKLKLAGWKE